MVSVERRFYYADKPDEISFYVNYSNKMRFRMGFHSVLGSDLRKFVTGLNDYLHSSNPNERYYTISGFNREEIMINGKGTFGMYLDGEDSRRLLGELTRLVNEINQ